MVLKKNLGDPLEAHLGDIIADIKSKKELSTLNDDFVEKKLIAFFEDKAHEQGKKKALEKLANSKSYKQFTKSKEHDFLIKEIRAHLRKIYGVFIKENNAKKDTLLKSMTAENFFETNVKLLYMHQSTAERVGHYDEIYNRIFSLSKELGVEKESVVILDLACGLNPVSSIYFSRLIKKYYASDISEDDCNFLNEYFKRSRIPGEAFALDLTNKKDVSRLKKYPADICFLFKALDSLETIRYGLSEELLDALDAKIVVVSFPTKSIGGKKDIARSRRGWFERYLEKNKLRSRIFEIENELFYVFSK